jgi:NADPH:quinone reductase-like Zn-dependent oxidoreductase
VRAVVHDEYGPPDVLRLEDYDRPEPEDDEVLVRVHATTVNRTDCHMRGAYPAFWRLMLGLRRPKRRILGSEFAGVVEAKGPAVTKFDVGDRVFGAKLSAHAEYVCVRQDGLIAHMPGGSSFEEAAAVFDGGHQGLAPLRRANVGEGTRLLVYGASGSCGTAAVQVARHLGAHVTAVCGTKNVELVRGLGADVVYDFQRGEDFTKDGEVYDVVLDAVGFLPYRRARKALKPGGLFIATDVGFLGQNLPLVLLTRRSSKRLLFTMPKRTQEDVILFKELIERGEYKPVIDRTYPLEDAAEAHRYVETLQKTGNVVLTLNGAGPS